MSKTDIHYDFYPSEPRAHVFTVVCHLEKAKAEQEIWLPNWIPGSYKIRDFSKHIISVSAQANHQSVSLTQLAKNRWRIHCLPGKVSVTAKIYAWDISVRGCHFDQTHGFFNGTHCFFAIQDQEDSACTVDFHSPEDKNQKDWKLATAMTPVKTDRKGFGTYEAANYDELIDHPFEMGLHEEIEFKAHGVPHRMAITGICKPDRARLCADLEKVCEAHITLFGGFPSSHYLFLTRVIGKGFNGLEHRASSSLVIARKNLPYVGMPNDSEDYATFLSLISHEYFHTWNVKRIKPEVFMPYDLDKESYTRQLWIFEGFTSYYEDLLLVRAGVITVCRFLALFSEKMESVLNAPGHLVQPVTDSSFCAWDKFYDPHENTPNTGVSYYSKGAVIAFLIDAYLRENTVYSLDDVMRMLWKDFGKINKGLPEGWLENYLCELTEQALKSPLKEWLYEAKDLPIAQAAQSLGLDFEYRTKKSDTTVELGVKCESDNQTITCCLADGAAMRAGLSAQDKLIAINGLSASADKHDILLRPYQPGDKVTVHAFRRDELMVFELVLQAKRPREVKLSLAEVQGAVLGRREEWLSGFRAD